MDSKLRNKIAKAADFSRSNGWNFSNGWYFDKVGEKLNATHKVDALEQLIQQEIAKAQVGELKSLQDCKNVAGETLVNTGTDVWIADRIAELSQAATDHQTQAA